MKERLFIVNNIQRINPELAVEIGLNESIIFLQLEYLISISKTEEIDGENWTYQSFADLQKNFFPYWCEKTIFTAIKNLEKMNLIKIGNFNKRNGDRTNWYAINYEEAKKLKSIVVRAVGNNTELSKENTPYCKNSTTLPETTCMSCMLTKVNIHDSNKKPVATVNSSKKSKLQGTEESNNLSSIAKNKNIDPIPPEARNSPPSPTKIMVQEDQFGDENKFIRCYGAENAELVKLFAKKFGLAVPFNYDKGSVFSVPMWRKSIKMFINACEDDDPFEVMEKCHELWVKNKFDIRSPKSIMCLVSKAKAELGKKKKLRDNWDWNVASEDEIKEFGVSWP